MRGLEAKLGEVNSLDEASKILSSWIQENNYQAASQRGFDFVVYWGEGVAILVLYVASTGHFQVKVIPTPGLKEKGMRPPWWNPHINPQLWGVDLQS